MGCDGELWERLGFEQTVQPAPYLTATTLPHSHHPTSQQPPEEWLHTNQLSLLWLPTWLMLGWDKRWMAGDVMGWEGVTAVLL